MERGALAEAVVERQDALESGGELVEVKAFARLGFVSEEEVEGHCDAVGELAALAYAMAELLDEEPRDGVEESCAAP
jgi:hypothetical protein